ncbi:MAG: branched-chain amino acid ABC transporter ATP-binding protein/permease [Gammaproteobacteria bacterium]
MILRNLATRGAGRPWVAELITLIVLFLCPLVLPLLGVGADMASRILIWGLFGLGFDILFGFTGLLSFGQAAFFGVGGFVSAFLLTQTGMTNVVLALFIGTLVAMVAGAVVGFFTLRRSGIYFAMITLAFAEMFHFLELSPLSQWTGGENGLTGVPTPTLGLGSWAMELQSGWQMFGFIAVFFFIGYVIAHRIVLSPFGQVLTALRDNSPRALATGHSVRKYKLAAFVIAAGFGGIAGGLLGVLQSYMPPDALAFHTSGQLVMQSVIGGAGTLFGPLLGAGVWLGLRDSLQDFPTIAPAWKLILGVVFVVLITVFRQGLLGAVKTLFIPRRVTTEPDVAELSAEVTRRHAVAGVPDAHLREDEVPDYAFHADTPHRPTKGLDITPKAADKGMPALECRNLTKRYGGLTANEGITLSIPEGQLRGIIGPNGAGKSTFFKMLAGEVAPTEGEIFLHGANITGLGVTAVSQLGMSKSYQINQLFAKLTVAQNLAIPVLARIRGEFRPDMLASLHGVPGLHGQIEATLEMVNLLERADVPVTELAYGEKRRLEIGLALANAPNVLLLDEPLAGMSPRERADTVQLLKQIRAGRTLVVVEHDMDAMFELAEYISVLQEGRLLAEGTPEEIKGDQRVQDAYLGGMEEV